MTSKTEGSNYTTTRAELTPDLRFLTAVERRLLRREILTRHLRSVLDVASGSGRLLPELLAHSDQVVAVEREDKFTQLARGSLSSEQAVRVKWVRQDVRVFTPDRMFDAVIVSGLMIYLSDVELTELATKLAGCLPPGGRMWSREPVATAYEWQRLGNERLPAAFYRSREHLHSVCEGTGLLRVRSWGFIEPRGVVAQAIHRRLPPRLAAEARPWLGRLAETQARWTSLGDDPAAVERRLADEGNAYSFCWTCFESVGARR